jgi:uncharacterized coiled-coil DUF342 family protein
MEKTLAIEEPGEQEAVRMQEAIARYIAEIDQLREEMRREGEAIGRSGERTDAILSEIAEVLAELKAA